MFNILYGYLEIIKSNLMFRHNALNIMAIIIMFSQNVFNVCSEFRYYCI